MALGPIMLDLEGLELSQEEGELLRHPLVGGVVLFSRNYHSREQLQQLTYSIRQIRSSILIAVDHEGGRVQRFRGDFTDLPAAAGFGMIYDKDPEKAKMLANTTGWLMAMELLAVGIDLSFAPVLDLDHGISQVIGDRAFHHNPEVVALLASAYMRGMSYAGMCAVGKHFPGHGAVAADSHTDIPFDDRDFQTIAEQDLLPFTQLVTAGLKGIMPAHVIYLALDQQPAGFSHFWLQQILRQQLGFTGAIFSDDLSMAGAKIMKDCTERARYALDAGCDMVLICNDRNSVIEVIEGIKGYNNPESCHRLLKMVGHFQYTWTELEQIILWQQARETITSLAKL
ncbi:beta-N-acetylhexosaminidase [soil metagenome]